WIARFSPIWPSATKPPSPPLSSRSRPRSRTRPPPPDFRPGAPVTVRSTQFSQGRFPHRGTPSFFMPGIQPEDAKPDVATVVPNRVERRHRPAHFHAPLGQGRLHQNPP